jgi:hypothetical protein
MRVAASDPSSFLLGFLLDRVACPFLPELGTAAEAGHGAAVRRRLGSSMDTFQNTLNSIPLESIRTYDHAAANSSSFAYAGGGPSCAGDGERGGGR